MLGVPPNVTTPPMGQLPKASTPSDTSSAQRNQLLKWESDEPLGDQATIAMILYVNQNHPNLKTEYPIWADRIKQIAKIWMNLPDDKRQPYVQAARENRTASRQPDDETDEEDYDEEEEKGLISRNEAILLLIKSKQSAIEEAKRETEQ